MNILKAFQGLLLSRLSIAKSVSKLAFLEMKLARLSIFSLLIWICLLMPVLIGFWGITLSLVLIGLYLLVDNFVLCLTILGSIHLIFLIIIICFIRKHIKRIQLSHTRNYLNAHSLKGQ